MRQTAEIDAPTLQDIKDRDAEINALQAQVDAARPYPDQLDAANREIAMLRKQLDHLTTMMSGARPGSIPVPTGARPGVPMIPGPTPGVGMSQEQVIRRVDDAAAEFHNRLNHAVPDPSAGIGGRMAKIEGDLSRLTGLVAKLVETKKDG
jgi:hypothetical protein